MLNFGWSSVEKKAERKRKFQSLCLSGQGDAMKAAIKSQKQSIIESLEAICDCVESRIFISISKWKWTKEEKLSPFVVPARSIVNAMNGINTTEWGNNREKFQSSDVFRNGNLSTRKGRNFDGRSLARTLISHTIIGREKSFRLVRQCAR